MDQQAGWTVESVQKLSQMAKERVPVATISLSLKKPIEVVRAKLRELGITTAEA